jgi:hypothetical protein
MVIRMKGIFYSMVTLLFILPILFFAFVYLDAVRTAGETSTAKITGDKMASFSKSIDSDLPRAVNIIARRSIEANINYIEQNGVPLDDAEARISETMINGTVYGGGAKLNNFTITIWAGILNTKGAVYGFGVDVRVISINITPLDSYHISVGTVVSVNITDASAAAGLYRVYDTEIPISIEGLVDPVYMLNTNGLIKRTILAPVSTVYGTTSLDDAVLNGFYMQSDSGPSFLDRLEGRLDIDARYSGIPGIGLERFVYLPELQSNGIPVKNSQNTVDYLYFDSAAHAGQQVSGSAYNWLLLDASQAAKYGVTLT